LYTEQSTRSRSAYDREYAIRSHWFYAILVTCFAATASFFFGYSWHTRQIHSSQVESNATLKKELEDAKILVQSGKKEKAIESLAATLKIRGASDYAPAMELINKLQDERRKELAEKEDSTRTSLNELSESQAKLVSTQESLRDQQAKLGDQKSQMHQLEMEIARLGLKDDSAKLAQKFESVQTEIREKLLSESKAAFQSIDLAKKEFCTLYRQGYEMNRRQPIDYNNRPWARAVDLAAYFDSSVLLLEKIHEQYVLGNTSELDARKLLASREFVWNKAPGRVFRSILFDCLDKLESVNAAYMPTVKGKQHFVSVEESLKAFKSTDAWKNFVSPNDFYRRQFSDGDPEFNREDMQR